MSVNLKITASNAGVNKKFNQTQKSIQGLTGSVKNLVGAYAGIQGAKAVLGFAVDAGKAFLVQEKAERLLTSAMRERGVLTDESIDRAKRFASAMQTMTTFGDEETLSVQTLLTQYGLYGSALEKATKASMDLASAKGMDLKSAADLLGKSVTSSTNAMSRYGITIEGAVGSTERLETAVAGVNEKFGGAAQAEIETYAGQLKQLDNDLGDIKETIGEPFVKAFAKATSAMVEFFNIGQRAKTNEINEQIAETEHLISQMEGKSKTGFLKGLVYGITTPEQMTALIEGNKKQLEGLIKQRESLTGLGVANEGGIITTPTDPTGTKKTTTNSKAKTSVIAQGDSGWDEWATAKTNAIVKQNQLMNEQIDREDELFDMQIAKGQEAAEAERMLTETKISLMTNEFDQRRSMLDLWHEDEREKYKNNADALTAIDEAYSEKKKAITQAEFDDKEAKNKAELQMQMQLVSSTIGNFAATAAMFKDNNEEAFVMAQSLAIAQAVMNTAVGATKALEQGGVFGAAMMASVIALGGAQIATIASTSFTPKRRGGEITGSGSGTGDNIPIMASPGETVLPRDLSQQGGGFSRIESMIKGNGQQSPTINFNGAFLAEKKYVRNILKPLFDNEGSRT